MKIEEIRALDDESLLKLSLERGGKHNRYTTDALKAQKEWNERKGNTIWTHNSNTGEWWACKKDRSYYASRYY